MGRILKLGCRHICCLSLFAIILTACASLKPLENTTTDPIPKRYDSATKKVLGNAADIQEIKKVIRSEYPDMNIHGIRWMSPDEAVVDTDTDHQKEGIMGGGMFECVLKKQDAKWEFIMAYQDGFIN